MYIFLSESGGTSKSHFVKVIYKAIPKTLLYYRKDSKKSRFLSLGPTGIPPINLGATTIPSGLRIKPGTKLLGLDDKYKASLKDRLSDVGFLVIDELCMVSSDLGTAIDLRYRNIHDES